MRLYPPAWIIGRRAIEDYPVPRLRGPGRIAVHREPVRHPPRRALFPDPERFDPDRWTPEFKASLPPFAYLPLAAARAAASASLRLDGAGLVASTIAQQWRLTPVPGHPVVPQPVVTLRMKHGLQVTLSRRQ